MRSPMLLANGLEEKPDLSHTSWERFRGYGVMGLPFASGHFLVLRRVTASSIGPPFTAIWHRDPAGLWTMYVDGEPDRTCPRFFGSAIDRVEVVEIEVNWEGPMRLSVRVPENRVHWGMRMASDAATRGLGSVARVLPRFVGESAWALSVLGRLAGPILGVGQLSLAGTSPNGQEFRAGPRNLFRIEAAAAVVEGQDLGAVGPLATQARLGAFWLPNGGVFATGEAAFETFNSARHSRAVTRWSREDRFRTSPGVGFVPIGPDPPSLARNVFEEETRNR